MKNCFKRIVCAFAAMVLCLVSIEFPKVSATEIPLDYSSAYEALQYTDYIIDGESVYLLVPYVLSSGQSWSYRQRSSAQVSYVSNNLFSESGKNYIDDDAIIMFRFDAQSAGIFRVALYLTVGGEIFGEAACFNFVVVGNENDGFTFSQRFVESDKIPMNYNEAAECDDLIIDGDLVIFCAKEGADTWSASISSNFTWETVINFNVPKQSVSEYALDEDIDGYRIIVLRITSAGEGTLKMVSADNTQTMEFPITSSSENGKISITDNRITYGDINGDSSINAVDATMIARASVGLYALSDFQKKCADVNGDGRINASDATLVSRYAVDVITSFPVQS